MGEPIRVVTSGPDGVLGPFAPAVLGSPALSSPLSDSARLLVVGASQDETVHNRSVYDRIALAYLDRQRSYELLNDHLLFARAGRLVGRVPPNGPMADLGCGPALDAQRLARRGVALLDSIFPPACSPSGPISFPEAWCRGTCMPCQSGRRDSTASGAPSHSCTSLRSTPFAP